MRCSRFAHCFVTAIDGTRRSASWLLSLMVPISLAVTLMQYTGILQWLAQYLNPLFVHLGLPGESAVIFMSGAAAGTYAGIAAMMSLPLTFKQASILAAMIALCHALPMECAVNRKTGSSFWTMAAIRIAMALLCALVLNMVLPPLDDPYIYIGAPADSSLYQVITVWLLSQLKMSALVVALIYVLMVMQRALEEYHLLKPLSHTLAPLMAIFGLPRSAAYMWLVGNVLGISYGSAMMLEMEQKGLISRTDANDVNYHLIMNHSMLEDTIVFAAAGISAWFLLCVRMTLALFVVWGRKAITRLIS
ncbi:MAG: nucleoside recognition domain-containing protein [Muribaculaceae bacterium]